MNKRKIIIALLALVIIIAGITAVKSIVSLLKPNLLENGRFEKWSGKRAKSWSVYDYQKDHLFNKDASEYFIDTENKYEGKASLCIINKESNDVRFKQEVKVKPSTTYKITAYFMVDGYIDSGNGVNISIIDNSITLSSTKTYNTDSQWKEVVVYGVTGEKQKKLELAIGLGGYSADSSGKVWIDNVSMEKVDKVPEGVHVENLYSTPSNPSDIHQNTISEEVSKVIFLVFAAGLIIYILGLSYKKFKDNRADSGQDWKPGQKLLSKNDVILMVVLTLTYLVGALYYLGDTKAPQTWYVPEEGNKYVVVSFGEKKNVGRVLYSCNIAQNTSDRIVNYYMEYINDDGSYTKFYEVKDKSFYAWKYKDVNINTSQIRIVTQNIGFKVNEIGFLEKVNTEEGYKLIENLEIVETNGSKEGFEKWFDEQDTVPIRPSVLNGTYFDEIYFPRTSYEHIHNLKIYETTHPPLGKIIQGLGIRAFGMTPFGWRIMGTLFGAAMIPVMYAFAKKLFNKTIYAFAAAVLIMFDCMHFAQTRLATIDSYSTLFIMLMYFFMYDIFITKSYEFKLRHTLIPLFFSGLFFGLGAATKWICLYAGFGLAILFFLSKYMELSSYLQLGKEDVTVKEKPWYRRYWVTNVNTIFWCAVLFFVVIPLIIYILSYIPYVKVEGVKGSLLDVAWSNQKYMYSYHSKLTAGHGYSSEWFTWPFVVRPIWYYSGKALPANVTETIASFGNPLVWIPGIMCLIASMYIAFKKKDTKMIVVFVAFACQFMPWILVTRAVFIYHYFSCVPFIILSIVYVLKHLREKSVLKPWVIGLYLAAVIVVFFIFYPALSGIPVPTRYIEKLRIFPSWWF